MDTQRSQTLQEEQQPHFFFFLIPVKVLRTYYKEISTVQKSTQRLSNLPNIFVFFLLFVVCYHTFLFPYIFCWALV